MVYNSRAMQPNILLRLSSVRHECWGCIDTFFGFPRIFNVKLCPWRGMAYHGGSQPLRVCVICMVCASISPRPCYISPFVRRGKGFAHVPMVNSIALE